MFFEKSGNISCKVVLKASSDEIALVKHHVLAQLDVYEKAVSALYSKDFSLKRIAVDFSLRGTCAGKANASKNLIKINLGLALANKDRFFDETIAHEYAHLVTRWMHPYSTPHGPQWRSVMRSLGVEPERTHTFDTSDTRVRKRTFFKYNCACKTFDLTSIRHNKILAGTRYSCPKCKSFLVFSGASKTI